MFNIAIVPFHCLVSRLFSPWSMFLVLCSGVGIVRMFDGAWYGWVRTNLTLGLGLRSEDTVVLLAIFVFVFPFSLRFGRSCSRSYFFYHTLQRHAQTDQDRTEIYYNTDIYKDISYSFVVDGGDLAMRCNSYSP